MVARLRGAFSFDSSSEASATSSLTVSSDSSLAVSSLLGETASPLSSKNGTKSIIGYYNFGDSADNVRAQYPLSATQSELYLGYYVRWKSGFEISDNRPSHLSYMFAGVFTSPTTTDLTIYVDVDDSLEPRRLYLVTHFYYQNEDSKINQLQYSDTDDITTTYQQMDWNESTPVTMIDDQWYFIEVYVKLNSNATGTPVADGEIKFSIDGTLISSSTTAILRASDYTDIEFGSIMIGLNMPADPVTADREMYYDDVAVYDSDEISADTNRSMSGMTISRNK